MARRPHPAVWMFVATRHVEMRVVAALAEAGFDDVTLAQGRVMARVGPNGTRLTDLATAAQITKQSAGFLVDQLEQAGYAERRPDPTDARARLVCIGERGQQALVVARRVERQIEREWERHLGRDRMRQLREILDDLREITDL